MNSMDFVIANTIAMIVIMLFGAVVGMKISDRKRRGQQFMPPLREDGSIIGNIRMVRLPSSVINDFRLNKGFGYEIVDNSCFQFHWDGYLTLYENGEYEVFNSEGIRLYTYKLEALVGHCLILADDISRNGVVLKKGTMGTVIQRGEAYYLEINTVLYADLFNFCYPRALGGGIDE